MGIFDGVLLLTEVFNGIQTVAETGSKFKFQIVRGSEHLLLDLI